MTAEFIYPIVKIISSSEVYKSEDGETYYLLFDGGEYEDSNICIPAVYESPNYYFYSGDGENIVVPIQNPSLKII
jgi:hypothetical protein